MGVLLIALADMLPGSPGPKDLGTALWLDPGPSGGWAVAGPRWQLFRASVWLFSVPTEHELLWDI